MRLSTTTLLAAILLASTPFADEAPRWSLRRVSRAAPRGTDSWGSNGVDAFVAAKLRERGLAPSPAETRRTLIRR
ncbi:MAG: hypothetical protein AAF517_25005, partial [Planctomycetota bacterium]